MTEFEDVILTPRYAPRLAPTPIPTAGVFDAPAVCVSVNRKWVAHLLGVMAALDQPDTWIGTEAEIEAARQSVRRLIVAFHLGNCEIMSQQTDIRLNDCVIEKSFDGGETWLQVGDLSDCVSNGRSPEIRMTQITETRQAVQWKYTDEPEAAWRTVGFVDDGAPGAAGADGSTPEIRMTTIGVGEKAVEWKYTNEPDEVPGIWRTAGYVYDGAAGQDGDDGNTPEIRMVAIAPGQYAVEWKYTTDPDISASWRTAGYINNGADGADGRTPEFRMTTIGAGQHAVEWKYTDEPDEVPGIWRTAGYLTDGDCDCVESPDPVPTQDEEYCGMAENIVNSMSETFNDILDTVSTYGTLAASVNALADNLFPVSLLITGITSVVQSILQVSVAAIQASLTQAQINEAKCLLYCKFKEFGGFSGAALLLWRDEVFNNAGLNVGIAEWVKTINVYEGQYWKQRAYIGSLSPSSECIFCDCLPVVPTISFETASSSINEDGAQINVPVVLSVFEELENDLVVEIAASGSADYPGDFTYSTSVTFPVGSGNGTTVNATVLVGNDVVDEDDETVILTLQPGTGYALGAQQSHTVTIVDEDDECVYNPTFSTAIQYNDSRFSWDVQPTHVGTSFYKFMGGVTFTDVERCYSGFRVQSTGWSTGCTTEPAASYVDVTIGGETTRVNLPACNALTTTLNINVGEARRGTTIRLDLPAGKQLRLKNWQFIYSPEV